MKAGELEDLLTAKWQLADQTATTAQMAG